MNAAKEAVYGISTGLFIITALSFFTYSTYRAVMTTSPEQQTQKQHEIEMGRRVIGQTVIIAGEPYTIIRVYGPRALARGPFGKDAELELEAAVRLLPPAPAEKP
jgi:hypothetical protein